VLSIDVLTSLKLLWKSKPVHRLGGRSRWWWSELGRRKVVEDDECVCVFASVHLVSLPTWLWFKMKRSLIIRELLWKGMVLGVFFKNDFGFLLCELQYVIDFFHKTYEFCRLPSEYRKPVIVHQQTK
jgi:hypothetical protein